MGINPWWDLLTPTPDLPHKNFAEGADMGIDTKELREAADMFERYYGRGKATLVFRAAAELDALRARVQELEAQLAEARELIKRHEDALEWLSDTPDYDSLHKNHASGMYALCALGNIEPTISIAMSTPLAAIEAAKGEKNEA